ncbi:3-deoxy-7-phosphoheptulonate synthase [Candidatus Binatia bacterium]|nr:3-deoxy-7-phosphoheptulonate synthase [Candidatus Binatia bacterium]
MIIVMKADILPESPEVAQVIRLAERYPDVTAVARQIQGATRVLTEVYLLGSTATMPMEPFEEFPAVEKVIRIRERYRSIGRHEGQVEAIGFTYRGIRFSQEDFHVFPGLCAVDSRESTEAMFRALQAAGIRTTRAGAYKPRTSPYDFQGYGKACLPYVFELAGKYGIEIVAMEITHEDQIDEIREALAAAGHPTGVMVQIGTRNAQNFELLKAVGQQREFPVLFKRGMGITLDESLNACEYVATAGNSNIVFCLRGMKTQLGDPHRNLVDFGHVPVVRRLTRLPVCIDPSHAVGKKAVAPDGILDIQHVTAQGVIAGANMVLVDFHPRPEQALCDGPQALLLEELGYFVQDTQLVRRAYIERCKLRAAALPTVR